MKRTIRLLAMPAAVMLILAGCGNSDQQAAGETSADEETTTAEEAPVDESDESEAWPIVEDEDGNVVDNPEDEGWPEVAPGEWAPYTNVTNEFTDDGLEPASAVDMEVRLANVECGLTEIEDGAENPDYWDDDNWVDGEPQAPEGIPAVAEAGKEFCIFTIEYRNTGDQPTQTDEPDGVMLENWEYHAQSELDHDISWRIQDYVIDLNPGDEGTYRHVVSIPAGSTPIELWYPKQTMVSGPEMSFLIEN